MVALLLSAVKIPLLHLIRLASVLTPFNLYLPRVRELPGVCDTLHKAATLFAFRLHRIIAPDRQGRHRFDRTLRLVFEQLSGDVLWPSAVGHHRDGANLPVLFANQI